MSSQPSLYDENGLPLGLSKMKIEIGAEVQLYADDDSFDRGHIASIDNDLVLVDFDDFEMEWPLADLRIVEIGMLIFTILPTTPGRLTTDYRDIA